MHRPTRGAIGAQPEPGEGVDAVIDHRYEEWRRRHLEERRPQVVGEWQRDVDSRLRRRLQRLDSVDVGRFGRTDLPT